MSKNKNSVDSYNNLLDDMFSEQEETEEIELTDDTPVKKVNKPVKKVTEQTPKKKTKKTPDNKAKRKANKTEIVGIRFTEGEYNSLKALADEKGNGVGEYIRKVLIKGGLI